VTPRAARAAPASRKKFAPEEYLRIVPLHHPKPSYSIDDLRRAGEPQDLFDGRPHPAPLDARLTYRNGPLLTNVEVFTVFWGKLWGGTASSRSLMDGIDKFFADILVSPLLDQLGEYSVPGMTIGRGSFTGSTAISANAPAGSITDSALDQELRSWLAAKKVPKMTRNSLYFIFLDPGVVSIMGGSRSCQNYCGYHNNSGKACYAVMPYPTCGGCLGGLSALDALTGTSSHELCESITDPVPGSGWYDDVNGEIGDICAWSFKQVAGHNVQMEWSNQQRKCV
jgi:hypothetical protein